MRILSSELAEHIGQKVEVQGWLHKKREMGNITFIVVRDRRGLVQAVDEAGAADVLKGLQLGTIIKITGDAVAEPRAQIGAEIHNPTIEVMVPVEHVMPVEIDKKLNHDSENFDTLFNYRYVTMRNIEERAIFKIQDHVSRGVREYLYTQDFTEFHSPKLLAGATEGGAEVFTLDYFGKTASLAQSAQFYKQMAVGAFERGFEIGATYRAEPSFTPRHMTEFTTIDVEMGFIDSLEDVWTIAEGLVRNVAEHIWTHCEPELTMWKAQKPVLPEKFPRITLAELHELYFMHTQKDMRGEKDCAPEEERWICEYAAKNLGSEAVFITEFPSSTMAFYHMKDPNKEGVALRSDLLFRGVEIATVPQREHRYDILVEQIKAKGLDPESEGFKYYVAAFKHGLPPHGGFGMGFERLTWKMLGLGSVKEATLFPRDVNRLAP